MARITVEDCLNKVNNRFALIHMAAKRVRQLRKGSEPTIASKNRDVVVSLREIAAGNVVIEEKIEKEIVIEELADISEDEIVEQTEIAEKTDDPPQDNEKSEEAPVEGS